jgi:ribose transport system substrate-binding protein
MRYTLIGLVAGGLVLTLVGGCRKSGKDVIAVIPKGTTHVFWKSVEAGAKKAAAEEGVEILWKAGVKESDLDAQVTVVESMISRGVKGIVLAPQDHQALVKPVQAAKAKGIPVVIIDSALDGKDYVSFVATDNYKGGQMAAQKMIRLLGDKGGNLVVLRYLEGHASTTQREQGFIETIEDYNRTAQHKFQFASTNQRAGNIEDAMKRAEGLKNLLSQAAGVYTPNEPTTSGMLRALQDAKLAGKIRFVGFDSTQQLAEGLAARQIDALVLQNPVHMGYMGVKTLVAHLRGKKVAPVVDTGCYLATPDNMNTDPIRKLLVPETK